MVDDGFAPWFFLINENPVSGAPLLSKGLLDSIMSKPSQARGLGFRKEALAFTMGTPTFGCLINPPAGGEPL